MKIICEKEILLMIKKAKLGSEKDIEKLISYYTPYIKSKSSKHNINGFDFEDLSSEGVKILLKCIESFKIGTTSFTPYFFRAVSNEFNYLLRKSYKAVELGNKIYSKDERIEEAVDVEDKLYRENLSKEISSYIRGLTGVEKKIMEDIYYKEKSMAEIARNLKYPFYKVQYIRNLTLEKLRKDLSKAI